MGIRYKIVPVPNSPRVLLIHPDTAKRLGIDGQEKIEIGFGIQHHEISLLPSIRVSQNEIRISQPFLKKLSIPPMPWYEVHNVQNKIIIGPYMGILATVTDDMLKKKLSSLTSYLTHYDQIGGAVLAFSLHGVDPARMQIHGYLYHPRTRKWVRGIYPIPASIFSILEVSLTREWTYFRSIMEYFQSILGDHLFNYPLFNKWEAYQWLHDIPELEPYFPETILYRKPGDVYQMLQKHRKIYLKPIWGRLGLGIMEASQQGHRGVILRYRKNKQNRRVFFKNYREFAEFAGQNLVPNRYLIQKSIQLLSQGARIVDFRLMMVKNQEGNWEDAGLFSRYGEKHSIVSNITAGGNAEWGTVTLRKLLHLSEEKAVQWYKKMIAIGEAVAKSLENRGILCGNLGFDFAIDTSHRIWIIEINNQNPDPYIALYAGKRNLFLRARKANMLYAKRLAGFYNELDITAPNPSSP